MFSHAGHTKLTGLAYWKFSIALSYRGLTMAVLFINQPLRLLWDFLTQCTTWAFNCTFFKEQCILSLFPGGYKIRKCEADCIREQTVAFRKNRKKCFFSLCGHIEMNKFWNVRDPWLFIINMLRRTHEAQNCHSKHNFALATCTMWYYTSPLKEPFKCISNQHLL